MTQPIYAIGDIHGQHEMLKTALARIEADGGQDALVVFLGDYTDRGPGSPEVLDLLIEGLEKGRDWHCLLGYHDQMFAMFMEDTLEMTPGFWLGTIGFTRVSVADRQWPSLIGCLGQAHFPSFLGSLSLIRVTLLFAVCLMP